MAKNLEGNIQACRHEYVKIFQRKFKDYVRRLTVTRGYLPTGFVNKDFAYLSDSTYCFCKNCRIRLHPSNIEAAKSANWSGPNKETNIEEIANTTEPGNIWIEEIVSESANSTDETAKEVDVDELQIETVDISDITESQAIVNDQEIASPEEEGES